MGTYSESCRRPSFDSVGRPAPAVARDDQERGRRRATSKLFVVRLETHAVKTTFSTGNVSAGMPRPFSMNLAVSCRPPSSCFSSRHSILASCGFCPDSLPQSCGVFRTVRSWRACHCPCQCPGSHPSTTESLHGSEGRCLLASDALRRGLRLKIFCQWR